MFEAWNSKQWNNTTGLLLWMTHSAWPSTVWQIYSWDHETFGAYFGASKACEPIHIQMNLDDKKIVIVNTSLKLVEKAVAKLVIYDLNGREVFKKETRCDVPINSLTAVFSGDIPPLTNGSYLFRLSLEDNNGKLISENEYWNNAQGTKNFTAFNNLDQVELKVEYKPLSSKQTITVTNPSAVMAVAVKLNVTNAKTQEIILPAYFSDGYFNLLPGETKKITVDVPLDVMPEHVGFTASGYNIGQSGR